MTSFDAKYWNLSQAAAWVVYRRLDLVEEFADQSDYGFASLKFYRMPDGRMARPVGSIVHLEEALQQGRVRALGRQPSSLDRVEVPAPEWVDLSILPPRVRRYVRPIGRFEPWLDLLFKSSELKKIWRSPGEVAGRTEYDWATIHELYEKLRTENPALSQNKLIGKVQLEYEIAYKQDAPADSTIKERIQRWKAGG